MRVDISGVQNLFEEKELTELKTLAKQNEKLIGYIARIVEYRAEKVYKPANPSDFQNTAWPLEKAHEEGRLYELLWMREFLTKG